MLYIYTYFHTYDEIEEKQCETQFVAKKDLFHDVLSIEPSPDENISNLLLTPKGDNVV